jgi:glyoxylase-like metal-dependent hydrolase (beta-lactamase superfamily II)
MADCVLAPNPSPMTLDGTNTWLLTAPGEQATVLVDPGPSDDRHLAAVLARLDELDRRVDKILLTHGHLDHSEGARLFAGRLGVPVLALDPAHRLGSEGLAGGQVVCVGGLEIEVVATAGHSSDSLSFFVRDQGTVLTGDTVLGRGTTVVAYPDGSMADYLDSLSRLRRLVERTDSSSMLPGHGPTVGNPGELLGDYLSHRQERLEQVRWAINEGAKTPMDVVDMVYQPIPDAIVPAALASVRAQWAYIQSGN